MSNRGLPSIRVGVAALFLLAAGASAEEYPFAVEVVDYSPAPGQFVINALFNDPAKALGPPVAGGISDGDESSVVTLGGFGGSIVLRFDHTVDDDPLNPFGLDAIVFGNAFWVGGDPQRHWAECGVIEISLDANGNGVADDAWFLIPGSHLADPTGRWFEQTWDDNVDDATYPPELASWIPPGRSGTWTTSGYVLPQEVFGRNVVVNPSADSATEGIFGYVDYSPTLVLGDLDADDVVDDASITAAHFYTVPDDPFRVGMTRGAGGGDAFDIAWAVDPVTGAPAHLPGFDLIRITNGNTAVLPFVGELSPEVDAVADVAPDPFGDFDEDGDIDLFDAAEWQNCLEPSDRDDTACEPLDRDNDGVLASVDYAAVLLRMTGPGKR